MVNLAKAVAVPINAVETNWAQRRPRPRISALRYIIPSLHCRKTKAWFCFAREFNGFRHRIRRHSGVPQGNPVMWKYLPFFVGLRYSLARRGNLLLSFVTLMSMLGISLGVMILIVALSVMNGSIGVLRGEALKAVPHATVSAAGGDLDWRALLARLETHPQILGAAPFVEGEAVLRFHGEDAFVRLRGVLPEREPGVLDSPGPGDRELFATMARTPDAMILSARLAAELGESSLSAGFGARAGEEASLLSLAALLERSLDGSRGFTISGFEDFGIYGEGNIVLLHLDQAREVLREDPGANIALRLKVADVMAARAIAEEALAGPSGLDGLGGLAGLEIRTWQEEQASLFNALEMEKLVTTVMLLVIVLVGAVNIVSTLVMVVADKSADIAILRTMGAGTGAVLGIFVVQGMVAGVAGTLVGAVLGVVLGHNVTAISQTLEAWLNALPLGGEVYLLAHLQTRVEPGEVALICFAALLISLLATLYPAWRGSRVQPAEVLRYE